MMEIPYLALIISLAVVIYAYFHWSYQYWKLRKCPFLPPKFPMGNSSSFIRKTVTFTLETTKYYEEIKKRGLKFAGIFVINRPALVVIHPDYIRDILSKDFAHFVDRGFYHNEKDDPLSAHLFALDDEKWKNMRNKLTPTFTSGKMKMMFNTILNCCSFMIDAIEKDANGKSNIDIRSYLASFTVDVIGSCAFGIDCNSFKDPESTFRKMGERTFKKNGFWRNLEILTISKMPKLALKLGCRGISREVSAFFTDIVNKTVKYREENNYRRPDFLHLLIDLKNSTKDTALPFTMEQLAAQVFLFFIAGFDTSSTTMNFTIYELCRNPDVQEKVRKEILNVLQKYQGQITYDSLSEMQYLQQVMDEAMRLYPPVVNLTRTCVSDYTLRDTDITIEKGTPVVIPLYALHRDSDYFPDPDKFDPERFSVENKASRHPYAHLPFGAGPRNCIGLRFGSMQSKIGLVSILTKFRLKISDATEMPLHLDDQVLLLKSIETLYVTAEKL